MINIDPLKRFMAEKGYTLEFVAQATGIHIESLKKMTIGQSISPENINLICSTFNLQPCDVIEWSNTKTKGHWVYVEEK